MKIGIGYTTHNRQELWMDTYNRVNQFRPDNSLLCFVDDNSSGSYSWCNYQFQQSVGVGVAKNKCLELLHDAGCTHFFLFDDDCRPLVDKWWLPYVESGLNHACWNYNRVKIVESLFILKHPYWGYEKPNGCMLYFTRGCLDIAGGWDLEFTGYGYEHCNLSDRIFNNGLTPARYIDVPNSKDLFEIIDCPSSFTTEDRYQIPNNLKLYQQKFYSKEFKPFK